MKIFLLLAVLMSVFPALAFRASFKPLVGDFAVTDVYTMDVHRRYETVVTLNDEGKSRLQELINQAYSCLAVQSTKYLCSKFLKDFDDVPFRLDELVRAKWGGMLISLKEALAEPELVYNSDVYKQWKVDQKALIRVGSGAEPIVFEKTVYTQTQDIWKIYLANDQGRSSYYFLLEYFDRLKVVDTFSIEMGNVRDLYSVTVFVQRLR